MTWFEERLHNQHIPHGYAQRFEVTRFIHQEISEFQELMVFDTPAFGRVLALDGIIQTTERDEFIYHEMLAHVPLFAHGSAKRVLIIGGGDGGLLREVLRHPVERVTMIEIDRAVVDVCRQHMPSLSAGAFDDPRADVMIDDGIKYVAETDSTFDIIIVDSTDPVGPGEGLFTEAFYANCQQRLTSDGIIITQSGVPFLQAAEVEKTHRLLRTAFADVSFFVIAVPTYVGGFMTLGWGSQSRALRCLPESVLASRFAALGLKTRYYTPAVHCAAFALPPFIQARCVGAPPSGVARFGT